MSDWVSVGAAGKQLGVSGGDIRRAGYTKVTTARLGAWEHEPPVWLRKAQARNRRSARQAGGRPGARRIEVLCLRHSAPGAAQPGQGLHAPSLRPMWQGGQTAGRARPARHGAGTHVQRRRILRRLHLPDRCG
jgi:hypothetical protein